MRFEETLSRPVGELVDQARVPVVILEDLETLYAHFARSIVDELQAHHAAGEPTRLILPVGPTGPYPLLVEITNRERVSWRNVYTFHMDEYLDWQGRPVPVDHPMSFRGFMHRELFDRIDAELAIPPDHVVFPDPFRIDEISERIREVGGVDTCYGGVGVHGHIAFNEPPISRWHTVSREEFRHSKTRVLPLAEETMVLNSMRNCGGHFEALPPMCVTLGMADLLAARRMRLYCYGGEWARAVLRRALFDEVSVAFPVTFVQEHPDAMIITDQTTAAAISFGP